MKESELRCMYWNGQDGSKGSYNSNDQRCMIILFLAMHPFTIPS